jgi:glycosyltransferase involved in cell wall biosynthesis
MTKQMQTDSSNAGQTRDDAVLVDVVIPVLNEAHVLAKSVEEVRRFLTANAAWRWRVVIVDNGSTDGTDTVGRQLVAQYDDVRFLQLSQRGRGRALRHAWTQSDADIMCYTDVDLSTEMAALPKLVHALLHEGYDLGTGSRLQRESKTRRSFKREFISRSYNLIVKVVLGTSFSDAQCGFKVVSRAVVREVIPQVQDESWFFDTELLALAERQNYRIKDLAVEWNEDDDSRVKIVPTAVEDLKGVWRLRMKFWRDGVYPSRERAPATVANRAT